VRLGEYSRGLVEMRGLGLDQRTRKPQAQLQTIVWGKLGKTLSIATARVPDNGGLNVR
jgi:hypothetical protein